MSVSLAQDANAPAPATHRLGVLARRVDGGLGTAVELAAKGMAFNQPDAAAFRDQLRKAGFYSEWKAKYGDEAWALLERSAGKLA